MVIRAARAICSICLLLLFVVAQVAAAQAETRSSDETSYAYQSDPLDNLKMLTEIYPPYQYMKHGRLQGLMVNVLEQMLRRSGSYKSVYDVTVLPWARGYAMVQSDPNTMLFGMNRPTSRNALFQWIGPVGRVDQAIIVRKDQAIRVGEVESLNQYLTGVIRKDVAELILLERGVLRENLLGMGDIDGIIRLLEVGRLDAWAYNPTVAFHSLGEQGLESYYEEIMTFDRGGSWFAFSLSTDASIIEKMKSALNDFKKSPDYMEIEERF